MQLDAPKMVQSSVLPLNVFGAVRKQLIEHKTILQHAPRANWGQKPTGFQTDGSKRLLVFLSYRH